MGTSLSGLTPATTFDGLLKTSDNDAIGTGLKPIGTGDGTDSVLQLSDSQLNVAGQFTIDSDTSVTAMNLRGDGLSINQIYQANETTYNSIAMVNSAGIQFKNLGNVVAVIRENKFAVGLSTTPLATTHIKGSGATSATTSLLVQNSAGANVIKANDDGRVLLGVGTTYQNHLLELNGEGLGSAQTLLRLQSSANFNGAYTGIGFTNSTNGSSLSSEIRAYRESYGNAMTFNFSGTEMLRATSLGDLGIGETTPTARLHIKGSGANSATKALVVQNSGGETMFSVRDDKTIQMDGSRFTFNSSAFTSYADILLNTDLAVGTTTIAANTRAHIKGSGATSATTALLVQNSAGTDLIRMNDLGLLQFGGTTSSFPAFKRVGTGLELKSADDTINGEPIFTAFNIQVRNLFFGADALNFGYSGGTTGFRISNVGASSFGVGVTDAPASAQLEVRSTTKGFLPPRMTTTERDAITTPAAGLMVYNTTTNKAQCYNGTTWNDLF